MRGELVDLAACRELHRRVLDWGASLVGFADLAGLGSACLSNWPWAVSIALALDPATIAGVRDGPTAEYYAEYKRTNRALQDLAGRVADGIRDLGHRAKPIAPTVPEGPEADQWIQSLSVSFQHKTAATRAGLGWVGKSALLITPGFGPRVRLATVLTDMPLPAGEPEAVGRCGRCRACVGSCPAGAIRGQEWEAGMPREHIIDARLCYQTATRLLLERVGTQNAVRDAQLLYGRRARSPPGQQILAAHPAHRGVRWVERHFRSGRWSGAHPGAYPLESKSGQCPCPCSIGVP